MCLTCAVKGNPGTASCQHTQPQVSRRGIQGWAMHRPLCDFIGLCLQEHNFVAPARLALGLLQSGRQALWEPSSTGSLFYFTWIHTFNLVYSHGWHWVAWMHRSTEWAGWCDKMVHKWMQSQSKYFCTGLSMYIRSCSRVWCCTYCCTHVFDVCWTWDMLSDIISLMHKPKRSETWCEGTDHCLRQVLGRMETCARLNQVLHERHHLGVFWVYILYPFTFTCMYIMYVMYVNTCTHCVWKSGPTSRCQGLLCII